MFYIPSTLTCGTKQGRLMSTQAVEAQKCPEYSTPSDVNNNGLPTSCSCITGYINKDGVCEK